MAESSSNVSIKGEIFPYDVMIDILKRVPLKSLIRFTSVSKDWSKLIKTPHFIKHHLHHSLQNPFLLLQRVRYLSRLSSSSSFCLIGPDLKVRNSPFLDFISDDNAEVVGSCNGLLCLRHTDGNLSICNPATRRFRQVPRTLIGTENLYYLGFGFSSIADDYKIVIVSVRCGKFGGGIEAVPSHKAHVNRVEVYSFATGSWRDNDASSLQNLSPIADSVALDGALFWRATMNTNDDFNELLVSFDLRLEKFKLLKGPPSPHESTAESYSQVLTVYNNKIAMFHCFEFGNFDCSSFDLWVLDNTDTLASDGERWIKQYSAAPFLKMIYPQSIWRDEIVCHEELKMRCDDDIWDVNQVVVTALSLFNPCSNELKNVQSLRKETFYVTFSYAESLVQVP